jgi:hypothetical protein
MYVDVCVCNNRAISPLLFQPTSISTGGVVNPNYEYGGEYCDEYGSEGEDY